MGLRGEVKCSLMTDFPARFNGLRHVTIGTKDGGCYAYQIERVRFASRFAFITFQDVTSREQAECLRGGEIQIAEGERVLLPADHYFRHEIVGLDVYLEGEILLGKVDSVLETGGNDVYVVKKGSREFFIPALKSVVKQIDLFKKEMIIRPMEGLLDL
ncbi:MAG: 16S rRNA processing protein RimM [Nitrospirae bacterium]|nr:16S rRNA processing protein RimM [Candidatus Troglogloeales bacterium]